MTPQKGLLFHRAGSGRVSLHFEVASEAIAGRIPCSICYGWSGFPEIETPVSKITPMTPSVSYLSNGFRHRSQNRHPNWDGGSYVID